jgi:hypothetical protein
MATLVQSFMSIISLVMFRVATITVFSICVAAIYRFI